MLRDKRRQRYAIFTAIALLFLALIGIWMHGSIGTVLAGLGGLAGTFLLLLTVFTFIADLFLG